MTQSTESRSQPQEMDRDTTTAIIVGAGTSGIAVAACLNRLSIPNIVVEREDCIASLWQKKSYDRLHLHLSKRICQLPHLPFPDSYPNFVPRELFVQYLNDYSSHFGVNPRFRRRVDSAEYDGNSRRWRVRVANLGTGGEAEELSGRFLVVATGVSCDPFVPEVEGLEGFAGDWIHSTEFRSGKGYEGKSVLVVGSGNSGMEIAFDLATHGVKTSIVARSGMHILSKEMMDWAGYLLKYMSGDKVEKLMVLLSRIWYGDLTKYGITRPQEGPFTMKRKYNKFPIIDVGTCQLIKSGQIQVLPAVKSIRGNEVAFVNGRSYPFDVIIFATGFSRPTKSWLKGDDGLLNDDGYANPTNPNHWKGKNGLYCVGLASRGFYGAGLEAQSIADDIKKHL